MDYQTKTNLILPFHGTLYVSNGGRTTETNNHIKPPELGPQNQLFAYDFRTEDTDKLLKLEEFPVFGVDVLAPAAGVVTQVIDGSIDVQIGERDRSVGVGNAVIIDHQNGEFSFLCHLQHQSIRVQVGEQVQQGQIVAKCGNTGNSQQPHIHFHLQNAPLQHVAQALPAQFRKIMVNGVVKDRCEPIRGDLVSNT